ATTGAVTSSVGNNCFELLVAVPTGFGSKGFRTNRDWRRFTDRQCGHCHKNGWLLRCGRGRQSTAQHLVTVSGRAVLPVLSSRSSHYLCGCATEKDLALRASDHSQPLGAYLTCCCTDWFIEQL